MIRLQSHELEKELEMRRDTVGREDKAVSQRD